MPKYEQSLQDYLNTSKGILKTSEILILMEQLLKSLEILHQVGYMHNDIKPSNIMIDSNLNLMLIDLGYTSKFMATST